MVNGKGYKKMILNYFKLYRKLRGGVWYLVHTNEDWPDGPETHNFWHKGKYIAGKNIDNYFISRTENYGK